MRRSRDPVPGEAETQFLEKLPQPAATLGAVQDAPCSARVSDFRPQPCWMGDCHISKCP